MNLQTILRYDLWANLQSLGAVKNSETLLRAVEVLAHMVAVNQMWLARAAGHPPPPSMWPQWTLRKTEEEMVSAYRAWEDCLEAAPSLEEEAFFEYLNSKGEWCRNSFEEVVLELVSHSAHHRGQVALLLRQAGQTPPLSTDFISALRGGCL